MFKRWLPTILSLAFLAVPIRAAAIDYTDIWWIPAESGWGVNLIQAEDVIFATFFIYGPNNQPTWYVATVNRDSNGNFTGVLASTVGPYFGVPWNPASYAATVAGTASFAPTSPYTGTLTYTLLGGPTVVKSIERQTLKPITLAANYTGGQTGTYAGCADNSLNGAYSDSYGLSVAQSSGNAIFSFNYVSGAVCTMSGTLEQHGQLYRIADANYSCSGSLVFSTTATMEEIKATAQGIEGRFTAGLSGGCQESAQFSAVLF